MVEVREQEPAGTEEGDREAFPGSGCTEPSQSLAQGSKT
jgi:hypothetical protein